jgi:uncharacterized membrane protein YqjE
VTEHARDEGPSEIGGSGTVRRAARVGRAIVDMHVELASREAARESRRVAGGVAMMLAGAMLFAIVVVMLHVAGTSFLHERYARTWATSALEMAAIDVAIGALLLALGRGRLVAPLMPETRGMLRRTVEALTDE